VSWLTCTGRSGSEVFLLDNMRNGGKGCITATGNINPGAINAVFERIVESIRR